MVEISPAGGGGSSAGRSRRRAAAPATSQRKATDTIRVSSPATPACEASDSGQGTATGSVAAAARIFAQADRPNLFIKIPGTPEGLKAIEESIFQGIPVNVTLLFSPEQYLAAAAAYWRGLERRSRAGLHLRVASVASLFVSRWDVAANELLPAALKNRLGILIAVRTYHRYRESLASGRWERLAQEGALPQRLLWASTGVKDPAADPTLYVQALALPQTINTLPSQTLRAVASHAPFDCPAILSDAEAEQVSAPFEAAGIGLAGLGGQLQQDGEAAFRVSWEKILQLLAAKIPARRAAPLHPPGGA